MFTKVIISAVILAVAIGAPDSLEDLESRYQQPQPAYQQPRFQKPRPTYQEPLNEGPAKYAFDWVVEESEFDNNFGQQETRDGDNTEGSYYVNLPDGRTQRVSYRVDGDSGFVADVTYDGDIRGSSSQYQEPQKVLQPTYQQPSNPQYGF